MLRIRQKRASKGITFAEPQTQASSSRSTMASNSRPKTAPKPKSNKLKSQTQRHGSPVTSNPPPKVSNRQRRLASLFMAFMASSSIPIETDAETVEAAQKASIAPKAQSNTPYKRRVSTIRVLENRASRWKRFRYEVSMKTKRKDKAPRWEEVEMDDLVELRRGERGKSDDMA